MMIEQVRVSFENGSLNREDILFYINEIKKRARGKKLKTVHFRMAESYMDLRYSFEQIPFERIRRITGYLVGTLDRFNDAKKAEEHDRVRHAGAR